MKKGQILEGYIERVDFPNKGFAVVEDEEKKVIVKNTVPEQKVRFAVNKIRKGQAEGRLLEILEHSPEECQPACPHFGVCGGCTYQNLPYEKQVEMKEAQIHAMMDAAVDGDYIWEGVKESPVRDAYRNKMEFSFGDEYKDGPLALGMHKRGSFHDIVNVTECKIVDEDFRRIIKAVLGFATDTGLPYYHRMRHTGFFRHLLVRKAVRTGEILIDLVTTSEAQLDEARLVEKLTGLSYDGKLAGILHTTNNSLADVVKDEGTKILYGHLIILCLTVYHPSSCTGQRQILLCTGNSHITESSLFFQLCRIICRDRHIAWENPIFQAGEIDVWKFQAFRTM